MFQRATLTIARLIQPEVTSKTQSLFTPTWIGAIGWITTIGFYGSLFYLGFEYGVLYATILWFISQFIFAIVPIPSKHFYDIIKRNLANMSKRLENQPELRAQLIIFMAQVSSLMKEYKIS